MTVKNHQFYDYTNSSETEINRLHTQAEILHNFEQPVFDRIISTIEKPIILDIGCNDGTASMKRLRDFDICSYTGIDISETAIENAEEKYGNENINFYCSDITDNNFSIFLSKILNNGKADIIIISLVLLHLEKPCELLKNLKSFLKSGGRIIIKDIDDRNNKTTYDPDGIFEFAYSIINRTPFSGNRHTGKNIINWLSECGYSDIKNEADGLSTSGMTIYERQALYETYFGFFIEDCEASVKNNSYDKAENDLLWCKENLPKIKQLIENEDFVFSLGFTIVSATV